MGCTMVQISPAGKIIDSNGIFVGVGCHIRCRGIGGGASTWLNFTNQSFLLGNTFEASAMTAGTGGAIVRGLGSGPPLRIGNLLCGTGGATPYPMLLSGSGY